MHHVVHKLVMLVAFEAEWKIEVCLVTDLFLQDLISFGIINIPTLTLNAISLLCLFSLSSSTVKIYVLGKTL